MAHHSSPPVAWESNDGSGIAFTARSSRGSRAGLPRLPQITPRAAVKDRRPRQAARASFARVIDGEHDVI